MMGFMRVVIAPGEDIKPGDLVTIDQKTGKGRKLVVGVDRSGFTVPPGSVINTSTGCLEMPYYPAKGMPVTEEYIEIPRLDQRRPQVDKLTRRFTSIAELAAQAGHEKASGILADTERALKRAITRAEALSDEWERIEVVQARGPSLAFWGKLLAEDEFTTRGRDPMSVAFEIFETRAGALIGVKSVAPAEREGVEIVEAVVAEPAEDPQPGRLAIMDLFDWDNRARSMVRKLGWDMLREID